MIHTTVDSPYGRLRLTGELTPDGVVLDSITFTDESVHSGHSAFAGVERQLRAYFDGSSRSFAVAHTDRGTPFQRAVWAAVDAIPYGSTVS